MEWMWLACFGENGLRIWCHLSFLSMLLVFGAFFSTLLNIYGLTILCVVVLVLGEKKGDDDLVPFWFLVHVVSFKTFFSRLKTYWVEYVM